MTLQNIVYIYDITKYCVYIYMTLQNIVNIYIYDITKYCVYIYMTLQNIVYIYDITSYKLNS